MIQQIEKYCIITWLINKAMSGEIKEDELSAEEEQIREALNLHWHASATGDVNVVIVFMLFVNVIQGRPLL